MKKHVVTLVRICVSVAALAICAPAQAQTVQNWVGPSIQIGDGNTNFGIDSKFGLRDNLSARPFIYFPNSGTDFGSALTYDFHLQHTDSKIQITPFAGGSVDVNSGNGSSVTTVGLTGGADFNVNDSFGLKAAVIVPLNTNSGQSTAVTLGAGFRF